MQLKMFVNPLLRQ